jgi:hypothetical protein
MWQKGISTLMSATPDRITPRSIKERSASGGSPSRKTFRRVCPGQATILFVVSRLNQGEFGIDQKPLAIEDVNVSGRAASIAHE